MKLNNRLLRHLSSLAGLIILICTLISSCGHQSIIDNPDDVKSSWKGTFHSNYHSNGKIFYWNLYDDGTMTGKWETKKNSTSINVEGVYQIRDNIISFHGKGDLLIKKEIKTQVQISGKGEIISKQAKGTFNIKITHPDYPNDRGTWEIEQI